MCISVAVSMYEMGIMLKAMTMKVAMAGYIAEWSLIHEGFCMAKKMTSISTGSMVVELDRYDFLLICEALQTYAEALAGSTDPAERTKAELAGRKLCGKLEEAMGGLQCENKMQFEEITLLENAQSEARNAFCGLGDDVLIQK